ncbi:MAG: hypothetical protein ACJAT2_003678 [Bacteriovoracaceae bacterium]|jgi:hypothetical protein
MTLVIITKVKLKQVNSSQLKWDPTGHPIWFNDLERDLYLIIGENELRHFEISIHSDLLSGGASKALQYGKIKDDANSRQDLSRLVEYKNEVPKEFKDAALKLISDCEGLEPALKSGLDHYIKGFNFGSNPLRFSESLKSYVPLEKRDHLKKTIPLSRKVRSLMNKLPKHLGLKAVGVLFVAAIIVLYFSLGESLGNQFLEMDERLNISYIKKYLAKDGELEAVDSLGRNILHRTAPFINSIESEQYKAFEYLVLNEGMNPNQFDYQGRTPLYYLISSYIRPGVPGMNFYSRDEELTASYKREKLVVIERFLKLGLDSRIKKDHLSPSAFAFGSQDPELKELLQKYR